MKRTIKKQIWMTKAEAQYLQKKAKKACMTEARLMRMLLEGYNPPEAPDERFYDAMNEMRLASERLEDVSRSIDNPEKKDMYQNAAYSLLKLQSELEKKYLLPKGRGFDYKFNQLTKDGMPTRYTAAKEALDEAISKSCNLQELKANLGKRDK